MTDWQQFYQAVKDPSWPECDTEDEYKFLPQRIRDECETLHGYTPGSFKLRSPPALLQPIALVPSDLFSLALQEVSTINWRQPPQYEWVRELMALEMHTADKNIAFTNNIWPVFLRASKKSFENSKLPWEHYYQGGESEDLPDSKNKFPAIYRLLEWARETVSGIDTGNVYLNCMSPGGEIHLHCDNGIYFKTYARYHIPLITNDKVSFSGANNYHEYMSAGYMYRLNNLIPHQVQNHGSSDRIHIIIDILLDQPNQIFNNVQ